MEQVLPFPAPSILLSVSDSSGNNKDKEKENSISLCDRIKKLVPYVARNGKEFEDKVKQKEGENSLFNFLYLSGYASCGDINSSNCILNKSNEGYWYYKWMLYCVQNGLSPSDVQNIEKKHIEYLKADTLRNPGFLDLIDEDKAELKYWLPKNTGSKDFIKALRKWIVERSHSIRAIGIYFCHFINDLSSTVLSTNSAAADILSVFNKILHSIYVLNDVLYNCNGASAMGPYTKLLISGGSTVLILPSVDIAKCLLPVIPAILRSAYKLAVLVDDNPTNNKGTSMKSKVTRVIELWQSKSYITANDVARINDFITVVDASSFGDTYNADEKVLTSPYLQKEITVNNSNPISTSGNSNSNSSSSSSSSSSNATSNTDSGGQSQEQLLKLQQIQQIQDQIQQHIAKLNQQQPPPVQPPPSQHQQQQHQSELVKPPREKLSAEQPVHFQPIFNPPPPENPHDSVWTSSFSGALIPGNMNMSMSMPTPGPGPYPIPTMMSYPQQQPPQQQQQQHVMGPFFPPPFTPQGPPPPPPPSNPLALPTSLMLDLTRMPVGQMSHLIKSAIKGNQHPKDDYCALDNLILLTLSQGNTPHVEPGRLEARVTEFYRKLKLLTTPPAPPPPPPSTAPAPSAGARKTTMIIPPRGERDSKDSRPGRRKGGSNEGEDDDYDKGGYRDDRGHRDGDNDREVLEGWERHLPNYEEKQSQSNNYHERGSRSKYPRLSRPTAEPITSMETEIAEDNMGHKLLRGLGWQQGVGLGADGSGIVEPVRGDVAGKLGKDRTGLGVAGDNNPDLVLGSIDLNQYRKMLSSEYHTRISERER